MKKILFASLLLFSTHAFSEVYLWVDEKGGTHFTTEKPTRVKSKTVDLNVKDSTLPLKKSVVMYSTAWCSYCKKARHYFRQHNITFIDYDIERDAEARKRYDQLGGHGIPLLVYDEKQMSGFSQAEFKSMYYKAAHKD